MVRPAPTDLDWNPLLIAALALVAVTSGALLGVAASSTRRRLHLRGVSLAAAVVVLSAAWLSPLPSVARGYLMTAHLLQINLVMGVAPPLLLLALPRRLPNRRRPLPFLRFLGTVATHPATGIILMNASFFGWHATPLFDRALADPQIYAIEQLTLFASSLSFWWAIIEPTGHRHWGLTRFDKLGYILLVTVPQTLTGLLFAVARHPLYSGYAHAPRLLGISALEDQQYAGVIMALLPKLALFAAFTVILHNALQEESDSDDESDRGGGLRDGDAPRPVTPQAPAWILLLARGRVRDEPRSRPRTPVG